LLINNIKFLRKQKAKKPINKLTKQPINQQGFSLILVMLVLGGILVVSLIVSSVVLRSSRSISKVSNSEKAYYAAETAAEKVLYVINKKHEDIGSFRLSRKLDSGAEYKLESIEQIVFDEKDIELEKGQSYQLDLDLEGADYPEELTISGEGKLIFLEIKKSNLSPENQIIEDFEGEQTVKFGDWSTYYYKLRIFNNTDTDQSYTLSGKLITGAIIKTKGSYQGTERVLETKDLKWQIY